MIGFYLAIVDTTMTDTLTLAYIQQCCVADTATNLEHTMQHIRTAAQAGTELVVLQELHRSLYFCQSENTGYFDLAESIPGPSTDKLGALARELGVVIVASLFEKRASGLYHNTAVVLEKTGELVGTYRKMHIPDDPGFYEKFYFTPGDATAEQGFQPIQTSVGKLGILVCWDQWFPEAARLMTLAGADLLIYPTAIGWDPNDEPAEQQRQLEAWVTIQRAHAVANGLHVIACNRTGLETLADGNPDGTQFWGNSFIAGPQGEILHRSPADAEDIAVLKLDMQRSEAVRRIWPYLRDRRVDAYQDLLLRYRDQAKK